MKSCKSFFTLMALACAGFASAQQNFTLYNMPSIPQRNLLNPALVPDCKWHVGIPAMNSNYFQFSTGGFNLRKVFNAMEPVTSDSSVLNLNRLLDIMSKKNYIALKAEVSWLSGGFKLGNHYFHASVQEKAQVRISLPRDLFRFILDGNGGPNLGQTFQFHFKADAIHYREWAVGYAYNLGDKLTIGGRVKYLQGFNIIETQHADVNLTTSPEDYSYLVNANFQLNTASSFGKIIPTDSNGKNSFKPKSLMQTHNHGMALDLGFNYKLNDKWSFNGSILDMGFIHWNQNVVTIASRDPNAKYKFDGIHVNSVDTNSSVDQYLKNVGDSLAKVFKVDTVHRAFNSGLSTEFFLGTNYVVNNRLVAGALFYGDFYNRHFYPALTLNANYKVGRALSVNISNTMYNRGWLNVGLGVSVNAGAFQIYSVMDNFLFPFTITTLHNMSWRFGSNITIGRERLKPKKIKHPDGAQ